MEIKIINTSSNETPKYAKVGDAGMDLRANLTESIILNPMERVIVPTGIFIELPVGYEAQIRPRSGLAAKYGVMSVFGTIDSGYRGEIKGIIMNLSNEPFGIGNGDRICQMVIAKHETVELIETTELSDTDRGDGGFGHTGK